MIQLYTFGPAFGLPDPSPFVVKVQVLLKMAGLPYGTTVLQDPRKGPKGKLPFLEDEGVKVADSTFIRAHLERKYSVDFDAGYSPAERALAWTVEKMLEDHLYFLVLHTRWLDRKNFRKGPSQFFQTVPLPIRWLVCALLLRRARATLHAQGAGRYSDAERAYLGEKALTAVAELLGDKPYLLGDRPCGADATLFAFVSSVLCRHFDSALRTAAEQHEGLVNYERRLFQQYFPDFRPAAAPAQTRPV